MSLSTQNAPSVPAAQDGGLRAPPTGTADPGLFNWLSEATAAELDSLPFGVISMSLDATVEHYNAMEGKLAGLTPGRVVGRNFFTSVAPCMNNAMVAGRFAGEAEIDAIIDYVLTLRMAPQRVKLRLLKRQDAKRMYVVVERRS